MGGTKGVVAYIELTCAPLAMVGYFHARHAKIRYFEWDGQLHDAKGKREAGPGACLFMLTMETSRPS
jgi:hypothetical protein